MTQKQTPSAIFRSMIMIHLLLCLVIALSVSILYTLTVQSGKQLKPLDAYKILELLLPIFGIGSFFGARFVINTRFRNIPQESPLTEKLEGYRVSMIMLWSILTGTALFGALGFSISGRQNLLLYGLMAGVFVIYFRPLRSKIAEDLNLEPHEVDLLNQ